MNNILLDTNVLIDFLRTRDKGNTVFSILFREEKMKAPCISLITVSEIWSGKSMGVENNADLAQDLIRQCEIIFPTLEIAKKTGEIFRECDYSISLQDCEIAATSIESDIPLLTLNLKDFRKIKGLNLYEIE